MNYGGHQLTDDIVLNFEHNIRVDFRAACLLRAAGMKQPILKKGDIWYNPIGYASEVIDSIDQVYTITALSKQYQQAINSK